MGTLWVNSIETHGISRISPAEVAKSQESAPARVLRRSPGHATYASTGTEPSASGPEFSGEGLGFFFFGGGG